MQIGILGGTFDPIHRGHTAMARAAAEELKLEKIILLPDGDPPHKTPRTPGNQRLAMARLAALEDARFEASDMELLRAGKTYTVDTLLAYKEQCPECKLIYIVGSDTLKMFPTWRTAHQVARLCRMAVVLRPGEDREDILRLMDDYRQRFQLETVLLRTLGPDISSTRIRQMAAHGEDIGALVPPGVAEYIRLHNLYQHDE